MSAGRDRARTRRCCSAGEPPSVGEIAMAMAMAMAINRAQGRVLSAGARECGRRSCVCMCVRDKRWRA